MLFKCFEIIGGRDRDRTGDLLVANEALSQLSYSPMSSNKMLADDPKLANCGRRQESSRIAENAQVSWTV